MTDTFPPFDPVLIFSVRYVVIRGVAVIRSKEAAGRERDRMALPTVRRLLERTEE